MFVLRQILGRCRALTRLVAFGLALSVLSACGQKGPLHLPDGSEPDKRIQVPTH